MAAEEIVRKKEIVLRRQRWPACCLSWWPTSGWWFAMSGVSTGGGLAPRCADLSGWLKPWCV